MLLYILYTKRFGLFQGEKYSNRNKLSLLAGFVLVEKIAGKKLASNMLLGLKIISSPLKCEDITVCGGGGSRNRLVLASNFFPDTKMTL